MPVDPIRGFSPRPPIACSAVTSSGNSAAEIIQAIAVKMKATKADFEATTALHPTRRRGAGDDAHPNRAPRAAGSGVAEAWI